MKRDDLFEDLPPEMLAHYAAAQESERLGQGPGPLERDRTEELLRRYLPPPPARVLDVGGGPGAYACWLAREGYEVHLIDAVPLHVEQARVASAAQQRPLASARVGDARALDEPTGRHDVVLLLGPLYHLTERQDRLTALREAARVLRPDGLLFAVGISRFASLLDGLARRFLDDPEFAQIVEGDLRDGQHRNPGNVVAYFTTAYFHHPEELHSEVQKAGFHVQEVAGIEGPGWLLADFEERWRDPPHRDQLRYAARAVQHEPSLLGLSAHLMIVARRTPGT